MAKTDKRIDHYIHESADFAKPILEHLRYLIHQNCQTVEETMKWGAPFFMFNDAILCSMAAFKQHIRFGFWLGSQLNDTEKILDEGDDKNSMRFIGNIKKIEDLPEDRNLAELIHQAMKLNLQGVKMERTKPNIKPELVVPEYFMDELKKNLTALDHFNNFSVSKKREYVDWITDAKTEATRNTRMISALEWISEGKVRNWKYEKC